MKSFIKVTTTLAVLSASTLIFTACGGGSSSESSTQEVSGYFIDAAVSGLNYECTPSNKSGITDENGMFTCELNDKVLFRLGEIPLGVSVDVNEGEAITPYTIFENNTRAALNLAQLLQTIDEDGDPSNGITPKPDHVASLDENLNFNSFLFDYLVPRQLEGVSSLVSESQAREHLNESLVELEIPLPQAPTQYSLVTIYNEDNCNEIYYATASNVTQLLDGYCMKSSSNDIAKVENTSVFTIKDATTEDYYLVYTDGINTTMISLDEEGSDTVFEPERLLLVDNKVFIRGRNLATGGDEVDVSLWVSDGTQDGTTKLITLDFIDHSLKQVGSYAIFKADSIVGMENDYELWVSDGTVSGTKLLKDINPDGDSHPYRFFLTEDKTKSYFTLQRGPTNNALWVTDGTTAGTQIIKEVSGSGTELWVNQDVMLGNKLFFNAPGGELWVSDGTEAGTVKVDTYDSFNSLTKFDINKIIYKTGRHSGSYDLFITDGTTTTEVPNPDNLPINYGQFSEVNGTMYLAYENDMYKVTESGVSKVGSLAENFKSLELYDNNGSIYLHANFNDGNSYYNDMFSVNVESNGTLTFESLTKDFTYANISGLELSQFHLHVVGDISYGIFMFDNDDDGNKYKGIGSIENNTLSDKTIAVTNDEM